MKLIAVLVPTIIFPLAVALAPPAYAIPTSQQICAQLDADPTPEALVLMMLQVAPTQENVKPLADQLTVAAVYTCPRHQDLIMSTMNRLGGDLRHAS